MLNYDEQITDEAVTERNKEVVQYVLENTYREEDGRLIMALLWNGKVCHLLGENYSLSRQILESNLKKLSRNKTHLKMTDDVFKEQEQLGIIECIDSIDRFREKHPSASFLPHMSGIKMNRESTKCRVVFLSNLAERDKSKPLTSSHNQTIYPGPNLNQKLNISLLQLRFGGNLLCFDLVKAFLMIGLREVDQNRLLFLWYRNIRKNDFTVIAYRMKRLAFGLTCSPCTLMLALYRILILDSEDDDDDMKKLKYLIPYMLYPTWIMELTPLMTLIGQYGLLRNWDKSFRPTNFLCNNLFLTIWLYNHSWMKIKSQLQKELSFLVLSGIG